MSETILFFDGDCSLCNKTVQFILTHEAKTRNSILFCSLQSNYAKQTLERYQYDFNQLSTLVLLAGNKVYYKSNAAIGVTSFLKAPYKWCILFKIVPLFIRDSVYNYIAKNRKSLIKAPFCYIPPSSLKDRFIE